ncbi:hypothetical protein Patl1_08206 [Pistacia atlantica]|uniref:Uncharacterized protein n=1 Tax=Pistacia atlantica TaxID=434234 RepID=A0ACC1AJG6_9ROSI|nr:hypothetical protein Patl1_08206 [Pistacia atlantica]
MVKVGLWCVQDEPALCPSMKTMVMMLEGITDVSIPPCPTSSSGWSWSILLLFEAHSNLFDA